MFKPHARFFRDIDTGFQHDHHACLQSFFAVRGNSWRLMTHDPNAMAGVVRISGVTLIGKKLADLLVYLTTKRTWTRQRDGQVQSIRYGAVHGCLGR